VPLSPDNSAFDISCVLGLREMGVNRICRSGVLSQQTCVTHGRLRLICALERPSYTSYSCFLPS
jgi:hypothetical protein